jgi:L-alanine-DL-glutamate epimerase-like enolase superfamily enzyme
MRITRIETIVIRHPWGPPERGVTRDWLTVRVHADNGLTGIGRGGDAGVIDGELAPLLIGKDPRRTAALWHEMYETVWRYGGPGAAAMSSIGAIDIALWDLYGKACGEPVWRLLGGYRDKVPAYADGIGYDKDLTPQKVAALVQAHAALGYDAVKFHLTKPDPEAALETVILSREALGPDRKLMIDAHRMWHGKLAAEMAVKFEPYNLFWIEEPVRIDDEAAFYRMVREATSALVAGGEAEGTLYGIRRLITEGGLQVVQTDIIGGGGFTGLMRIAAVAEAHHVYVAPHGARVPEINAHLVAAIPNGLMVSTCPEVEPYQIWSRMYDPAFEVVDGQISLTDKPGLGLELDEDFLREYSVS